MWKLFFTSKLPWYTTVYGTQSCIDSIEFYVYEVNLWFIHTYIYACCEFYFYYNCDIHAYISLLDYDLSYFLSGLHHSKSSYTFDSHTYIRTHTSIKILEQLTDFFTFYFMVRDLFTSSDAQYMEISRT